MLAEIASIPVVDSHCHHVTAASAAIPGADWLGRALCIGSIGSPEWQPEFVASQPSYRRLLRELAAYLGLATGPAVDPEAVIQARNARAAPDYGRYMDGLFAAANIAVLLLDLGFPGPDSYPEFDGLTSIPRRKILRVDTLASSLARERPGFEEFWARLDGAVRAAVSGDGVVALKSYIAGRTGLAVEPAGEPDARDRYPEFLDGRSHEAKAFWDYLFARTADLCAELDIPLQVHASVLGGSTIAMDQVRPSLLQPFLRERKATGLKLVLVHGGFPWVEEAAMLAISFPRVWLDMSLWTPFLPASAAAKLLDILRVAPPSKVLYASDGAIVPELHWFSALTGREAVGRVLDVLRREGSMTPRQAVEAATMILCGNSKSLYRL